MIVEKQEKLGWGKSVVETLASDLQKEFPGTSGFSSGNLWRIRNFYDIYRNDEKLAPLVREIGWSHNVIIFEKCKKPEQKKFYLVNTLRSGWTKDILLRQINTKTFENHLHNQTNFDRVLSKNYANQAKFAVKDSYIFDFLELGVEHAEKELQTALIGNIRRFLLELGNWYTFIGSQYRLEIEGHEYFIDLLLFHRKLKSLIAIETKIGEFIPEYKGKMEFYLALLNEKVKEPEENDSIGIIICRNKNKTIVEYSLKTSKMPIGVATYTTNSNLPEKYQKFLPDAEELGKKLQLPP
jgi:predicted nuclease of restriction endonuclease-like (RecB) superfamily